MDLAMVPLVRGATARLQTLQISVTLKKTETAILGPIKELKYIHRQKKRERRFCETAAKFRACIRENRSHRPDSTTGTVVPFGILLEYLHFTPFRLETFEPMSRY